MRTTALALLAATALTAPALAQPTNPNVPQVRAEDRNMRVQNYSPFVRTRLVGTIGRPILVTLDPAEEIKRIIVGDAKVLEGPDPAEVKETPLGNNVPLYPTNPGQTTVQIITQRPGLPDRPYQFSVVSRPVPDFCREQAAECDDPEATYGLTFRYPEDEAVAKAAARETEARATRERWLAAAPARQAARMQSQQVAMRERLEVDFFGGGGYRNWRYEAEGNAAGRAALVPDKVTDNGQETAFLYAGNRAVPSFFTVAPDGSEQSVQPVMRGAVAVLPQVVQEWRVRLGDAVLVVHNRAYSSTGYNPGTGTTSPDVVRVIRHARAP